MVAVRIFKFQKENLDIPSHLKTVIPTELRDAFYRARFAAGVAFRYVEYMALRHANRYQAMCPAKSVHYRNHQLSILRLFSWHHDYHWRNPTLAPTEKLDRALLDFHIDQTAYRSYEASFIKYRESLMVGPFRAWQHAKRGVEVMAAKSKLSEVNRRMWNQFWYINFQGEMLKWESRFKALVIPPWEEIVDELYEAILECVEGAEDFLANSGYDTGSRDGV
ncbi:hypothetical protein ETB97_005069 [Aspergillus alliaceus]|uniref:Uncharacterized protein n=1 Tax=Petromyces alliaceus TaxID=209559 RepID=A0A5N7CH79_PETAA|nr:uncharacterized protein BDW43DRAFT_312700 [Aspergillus alliaceus]KAB8231775.1 hypothetical protein BDW43DRAFT_312700 [Aspergillus alliaceus]KAE8393237.1 hypothetical protein BDV23DRAFT_180842 [Aspergillus alliaceus]KAF5865165.1 hypothetical protein ETB97_005069 [Aspergillus burnettii]